MKIDSTGVHIDNVKNLEPQQSLSQANAIAFMTDDGVWIHIDISLINTLYRKTQPLPEQKVEDTIGYNNNPFVRV